jgi:pimeloyl-ACP methyl ester carboxylesterase
MNAPRLLLSLGLLSALCHPSYAGAENKALGPVFGSLGQPSIPGVTRKPSAKSYALVHPERSQKGVVVMLHGFSEQPGQMRFVADRLYGEGYDVVAPALIGHGLVNKDGSQNVELVPKSAHPEEYAKFGDRVYASVTKHWDKVHLVGLSGGGMTSLGIAERHGQELNAKGERIIQDVVAVSPYLAPSPIRLKLGPVNLKVPHYYPVVRLADRLTDGWVGRQLDKKPFLMKAQRDKALAGRDDYGFYLPSKGQAYALTRAGGQVLKDGAKLKGTPVQFIISEADTTANPASSKKLARKIGGKVVDFPESEHVVHAMISPNDNPDFRSVEKVADRISNALAGHMANTNSP